MYGLVAVTLLAILVPPFQNADEVAHFQRAASMADGHLGLFRFIETEPDASQRVVAGGPSDPAIVSPRPRDVEKVDKTINKASQRPWLPQSRSQTTDRCTNRPVHYAAAPV